MVDFEYWFFFGILKVQNILKCISNHMTAFWTSSVQKCENGGMNSQLCFSKCDWIYQKSQNGGMYHPAACLRNYISCKRGSTCASDRLPEQTLMQTGVMACPMRHGFGNVLQKRVATSNSQCAKLQKSIRVRQFLFRRRDTKICWKGLLVEPSPKWTSFRRNFNVKW